MATENADEHIHQFDHRRVANLLILGERLKILPVMPSVAKHLAPGLRDDILRLQS